jgi:hypothetical protein
VDGDVFGKLVLLFYSLFWLVFALFPAGFICFCWSVSARIEVALNRPGHSTQVPFWLNPRFMPYLTLSSSRFIFPLFILLLLLLPTPFLLDRADDFEATRLPF